MTVYVDADACPKIIKEIIYRAALRTQILTVFVANHWLELPKSDYIKLVKVGAGADVADDKIVSMLEEGDLVITADIPLAYAAVQKAAVALNPRGKLYTKNNIQDALATRDLLGQLRDSGEVTGGPKPITNTHKQEFANNLDKYLSRA